MIMLVLSDNICNFAVNFIIQILLGILLIVVLVHMTSFFPLG